MTLRDRIAAELRHNDECGPGPVSDSEYRDDADAILTLVVDWLRDGNPTDYRMRAAALIERETSALQRSDGPTNGAS